MKTLDCIECHGYWAEPLGPEGQREMEKLLTWGGGRSQATPRTQSALITKAEVGVETCAN